MKRYAFSAVVALVLGLGAFGLADAQWRGRGPGGGGPMFGGGPGPLGFAGVQLTDAQREQIRTILEEERASRKEPPAGADLHQQLRAELLADAPDQQKLASLREQIVNAQGERLARQIALQQKLVEVLTPEQRAQAREALAKQGERRRERQGRAGLRGLLHS